MLGLAVVLGGVGAGEAGLVAGHVDHGGLHAVADAEIRDAVLAGVLGGGHFALEAAVAEATGHEDGIDASQDAGALGFDLLRLEPLQRHLGALAQAAVLERFGQRLVGVLVVDVLADDRHGDGVDRVLHRVDDGVPLAEVRRLHLRFEAQALDDDLVEALLVQPARDLVDVVEIDRRDDGVLRHVGEQRDLAALAVRQWLLGAAQQHVGLDTDRAQFLHGMLGGLGLQLARRRDVRHEGEVHEDGLVRAALGADLADRLEEGQRLDVAHRAADLHQADVEAFGGGVDAALDLVGDVRDDLHGRAEVVAAALLADHFLVDAAGGDRVLPRQVRADEALVVAEVEVGLGAVVGDVDLAVLERAHGARVHVDVGVQLHHRHAQAARFEDGRERSRRDALAKRGHHAAGHEDQGSHGSKPRESGILPARRQDRERARSAGVPLGYAARPAAARGSAESVEPRPE